MKDVYITGDPGSYHLILREWYFQGDRPDYTILKKLTDVEAFAMQQGGVEHLCGRKVERPRVRVPMAGAEA